MESPRSGLGIEEVFTIMLLSSSYTGVAVALVVGVAIVALYPLIGWVWSIVAIYIPLTLLGIWLWRKWK